jgi:uncharacterized protein
MNALRALLLLLLLAVAAPAAAQNFPKLTGRVVDTADLLTPQDEAALTQKLETLEQSTHRQLVVATVPDLQGYPVEDYGTQLGRTWGIGQKGANNGVILLIAKNDRKIRIEVGYGMEPIINDALAGRIIRNQITPRFKQGDFAGGINAGADAIIEQLRAPPEEQEKRIQAAAVEQRQSHDESGSFFPLIFWGIILLFVILPAIRGSRRGRRYRGSGWPVMLWGPGLGGGWGGGSSSGSSWGGFSGGGGGGGFSGGGGSFGGGGASGGW